VRCRLRAPLRSCLVGSAEPKLTLITGPLASAKRGQLESRPESRAEAVGTLSVLKRVRCATADGPTEEAIAVIGTGVAVVSHGLTATAIDQS
jgi:hypothetical protein